MEPVNIANANCGSLKEAMGKATKENRDECRRLAGEFYDALARAGITLYGLHMEAPQHDHHAHEIIGALKTHITYRRVKDE